MNTKTKKKKEEFRPIPGFPDYLISNLGRIKSKERRIKYKSQDGQIRYRTVEEKFLYPHSGNKLKYGVISLRVKGVRHTKYISRLMLQVFGKSEIKTIPTRPIKNEISPLKSKKIRLRTKLNEMSVKAIKNMLKDGVPKFKIAQYFEVNSGNITHINNGDTWKHV